ncbi:hypothetical protein BH09BAC1_BH09BAC1_11370 [soil metagenome]
MKHGICLLVIMVLGQEILAQQPLLNKTFADYEGNIAWSIIMEDSSYVLAGGGWSDTFGGFNSIKILRVSHQGVLDWTKVYGQSGYGYYMGLSGSLIRTRDGNYVGFGTIVNDATNYARALIIKFNAIGDTLWTRSFPRVGRNIFFNGIELSNGDLIATGSSTPPSSANSQMWLVKMDSLGTLLWQRTYGGTEFDESWRVIQTEDDGFILAGATNSFGAGLRDGFIVKTDSAGSQQWQQTYGTGWKEYHLQITSCSDGGYYIWGNSQNEDMVNGFPTYEKKAYITKITNNGDEEWTNVLHQDLFEWAYINDLKEIDEDGNLFFVGRRKKESDIVDSGWIGKLDSRGTLIWERYYTNTGNDGTFASDLKSFQITPDNRIACSGMGMVPGTIFANQQDFWLLVLDSMGCLLPGCDTLLGLDDIATARLETRLYPNPTNGTLTIELPIAGVGVFSLYSLLGQQVFTKSLTQTTTTLALDFPSGIYLYRITQNGQSQTGKLVVE